MAFLGVYRAIYDYVPQSEGELTLTEGDLLFVLDNNSDDDWWKAKKKAMSDEEDEPEGLIPNNYIEEAHPLYSARALYDYTKQTDEELSFPEDARLDVYDTSDEDWTLVGLNGEYGFAPAIYIEKASAAAASAAAPAAPAMPARPQIAEPEPEEAEWNESPPESPVQNPAAALAGIIAQKTGQSQTQPRSYEAPMSRGLASPPLPSRPQYTPDESEDEPTPSMPPRPTSSVSREPVRSPMYSPVEREPQGVSASLPYNRAMNIEDKEAALRSPGGFRLYNISEVVSHMGKNKKMPITLGINLAKGLVSLSPAKAKDGPSQEWTADRLSNYSIEGKHVFLDLVRPSKSVDLHAGAKDTAQEIIGILSELAGASKAEGLREVWAASSGTGAGGKKKGTILYDFMAQGDDEVTVAIDDEVVILDDTKSEEWWMVKRLKNGKEGVVPSSYVEITGTLPEPSSAYTGLNAARSTVEQNRLEEQRLTREVARSSVRDSDDGSRPERHSSLAKDDHRKSRHSKSDKSDKPKPNAAKVRTWTDRSGSFKVEAEFIGLKDGKIHLHKQNGVKIAVPVNKMAIEDLEYVERATGVSLDEDKPLSEIKRRSTEKRKERPERLQQSGASSGAVVEQKPDYDWFDFFLGAGVNPQICERYAAAFSRDQMGEEILPDVDTQLLRTLGLKEGDILRVMKYLDNKFGRTGQKKSVSFGEDDADATNGEGGLFSGPGGALRNNTRKGRPAPAVQTNDVVDPDAFKQKSETPKVETPLVSAPARAAASSGFDDDAWDVKPSKNVSASEAPTPAPAKAPSPPPAPAAPEPPKLTQNMSDLSLLSPALQPTPAPQAVPQAPPAPPQQPARTGADPSFFDKLAAPSPLQSQMTGMRQRPAAPTQMQTGNSMIAPPPQRAASAPGLPQQGFAPPALQPQMTGYQAPPGQSLQNLQQQQQFQQQQMTGFPQQPGFQGLMPQATGYMQSPQQSGFPAQYQMPQATGFGQQQPYLNGQATGSPFADPSPRPIFQSQPTGMAQSYTPGMQPQQTGFGMPPPMQPQQTGLPPALQPQRTGFTPQSQFGQNYAQQQQTGFGGYGQQAPPMPPMPPMPAQPTGLQPLVPQKTGPPPPVRFGVQPAARLTPQPTGRANLSKATPQNPFGF
ncbi:hypothetical protein D6D05_02985 [Aureobasidium pullulans]|nr:hypothetical protein D6D05_02985 [Aureobasidium pullulans]